MIFKLHRRKVDGGQPTCRCTSAEGVNTDVLISDNKDGTFTIDVDAKEPGLHSVDLEWDSRPVPGSPFMVHISQAIDAEKVKADGPGLKSGILGKLSFPTATMILSCWWQLFGGYKNVKYPISAVD